MHIHHHFFYSLNNYIFEVLPALVIGFLLSGIIHEFVPEKWVEQYLGKKGILPIFYSTLVGTFLPICCWGSLPVALSFYKKGSRLGPVLAFLVATPATSVSALTVSYKLLGFTFTVYTFFTVIVMGLVTGILGNFFTYEPKEKEEEICPHCTDENPCCEHKVNFSSRIIAVLKYAFIDMPKEIGIEILIGLIIAAAVASFFPVGNFIKTYLAGGWAYLWSLFLGLVMYFCSTASVPLIDALIKQGMNVGAALVLLLVGPITSYGTILVLRKEFGMRILIFYLSSISIISLIAGWVYQTFFVHKMLF